MLGHTHIGLALALTYGVVLPLGVDIGASDPNAAQSLAIAGAVMLGALAPDLDHPGSAISRPGNLLRPFLPRLMRRTLNLGGLVVSRGIGVVSSHRGVLHYPLTAVVLWIAGLVLGSTFLVWFAWGYATHLLGDFCTVKGIPVFGPFRRRSIEWSPLRTGSLAEGILSLAFWCCAIGSGYHYLPESQRIALDRYLGLVARAIGWS